MTEVIPGIYQIKLPLPGMNSLLGYVNTYLVRGDNGCLVVDTGLNTNGAFGSLKNQMAEVGVDVKDVTQIVITHIHPDHYGLIGRLKEASGARFYLHEMEDNLIDSRYLDMDDLLQKMADWLHANGVPPADLPGMQTASVGLARFVARVHPDITLHGGETIFAGDFAFRVLWTPGHSPGHIALYEPTRKILISGDHVLPTITPNIGLHPQSGGNPLGDYLKSLDAIKRLDVGLVLPGHEEPFTGLKARAESIIHHHEQRNSDILSAMKAGATTGYEIARSITWLTDTGGAPWQDLTLWDRRLAVLETLAHLEAMKADGRISQSSENSLVHYRLTG